MTAKRFVVVAAGIPRIFNGQTFSQFWSGGKCWSSEPTEHEIDESAFQQMQDEVKRGMPLRIHKATEILPPEPVESIDPPKDVATKIDTLMNSSPVQVDSPLAPPVSIPPSAPLTSPVTVAGSVAVATPPPWAQPK